jgi:hypothetical protein
LEHSGLSDDEIINVLGQYSKDPQHGLVEALSRFIHNKATHGMQVR